MVIRAFCYDKNRQTMREVTPAEIPALLKDDSQILWVNYDCPTPEDVAHLERTYPFHPLAVEDALHTGLRPKVDEYDDHLFLLFHAVNYNENAQMTDTIELKVFVTKTEVVTLHRGPLRSVQRVQERVGKNPRVLGAGTDRVLYELLDAVVDNYFPLMEHFGERVQEVERGLFERPDPKTVDGIFALKKEILHFWRHLGPQVEILRALAYRDLAYVGRETQRYLKDVLDHLQRVEANLQMYRDLLSEALNAHLTQISNRMNEVMKTLSIVATIMLPLTFLTGVYGMNVEGIPLLKHPQGFWLVSAFMALLGACLFLYFRKKRWF